MFKNDNTDKVIKMSKEQNRNVGVYDPSKDAADVLKLILSKFGEKKEYMSAIAGLIEKITIDKKTGALFFEVDEEVEDDDFDCENCESKDCCEIYKDNMNNADTINKSSSDVKAALNEDRDYVRIFSPLFIDDLNNAISKFEDEFNDHPYLIMSKTTLMAFEQTCQGGKACEAMNCDVDMDCEDCPAYGDDEDEVYIEHDCERGTMIAYYLHNDEQYAIAVDDTIDFGVVKVR